MGIYEDAQKAHIKAEEISKSLVDDYDYESALRGEREWSYSAGNKVVVTFKDANGRPVTMR